MVAAAAGTAAAVVTAAARAAAAATPAAAAATPVEGMKWLGGCTPGASPPQCWRQTTRCLLPTTGLRCGWRLPRLEQPSLRPAQLPGCLPGLVFSTCLCSARSPVRSLPPLHDAMKLAPDALRSINNSSFVSPDSGPPCQPDKHKPMSSVPPSWVRRPPSTQPPGGAPCAIRAASIGRGRVVSLHLRHAGWSRRAVCQHRTWAVACGRSSSCGAARQRRLWARHGRRRLGSAAH